MSNTRMPTRGHCFVSFVPVERERERVCACLYACLVRLMYFYGNTHGPSIFPPSPQVFPRSSFFDPCNAMENVFSKLHLAIVSKVIGLWKLGSSVCVLERARFFYTCVWRTIFNPG